VTTITATPLPTSANMTRTSGPSPPKEEENWKASLQHLHKRMGVYDGASKRIDYPEAEAEAEAEAEKVAAAMRRVGDNHTDPDVKKVWYEKADNFATASPSERATLFDDIGKGLLILLATPFALAGAAIFSAGAILYGTGMLVKGLGNVLTFGAFGGRHSEGPKDKGIDDR
jgi:hypothetical protein